MPEDTFMVGGLRVALGVLLSLNPLIWSDTPLDAPLRDSRNSPVALSQYRGRPTILFFEDKGSSHQNEDFKKELREWGNARSMRSAANVVAVADLHGYDFFPARTFALDAVRRLERKHGLPVLVDWKAALCAPPWNLPHARSSVVFLDGYGRRVYAHSGPLSDADKQEALAVLKHLLNASVNTASNANNTSAMVRTRP